MTTRRAMKAGLAAAAAGALLLGSAAPAAAAGDDAIASSSGWVAHQGSLGADLDVNGVVGWLLGPVVNPVLDAVLHPVTELLNAVPASVVGPVLGAVAGADLTAGTPAPGAPASTSPFVLAEGHSPANGAPASCTDDSGTCYVSPLLDVGASGLLGLDVGVIHGLTEPVATAAGHDLVAQAQVAGLGLDLLGIDLLDLGAVTSSARCTVVGEAPNAAQTELAGVRLLELIDVGLAADGSALTASIAGVELVHGVAVGLGADEGFGLGAEVELDGSLVTARVALDTRQVLGTLLGHGALLTELLDLLVGASTDLVLQVGPGLASDATSAEANGLRVSVGLELDLGLNVLGLVGAEISTSPAIGANGRGNILTLDLARAACASTSLPGSESSWIPPGLT